MSRPPYPPDYVKLPTAIARAPVHDGLIVTMARIMGLCWRHQQQRSPAYTPAEMAELVGRPRATLYRHLTQLVQLGWLEVDRLDGRLVLRPTIQIPGPPDAQPEPQARDDRPGPPANGNREELRQALRQAGIIGRPLRELLQQDLSAVDVRAWRLWTSAGEQAWLENPAGYVVTRLRNGDPPPQEFVDLARLTAEEIEQIQRAWIDCEQYRGWPSLDEGLAELAPVWLSTQAGRHYSLRSSGRAAQD